MLPRILDKARLATAKALLLALLLSGTLHPALLSGQQTQQLDRTTFLTGLNSQAFDSYAVYAHQRGNIWCWAACIEQALTYCGLYVSQEQVVERCFGGLYDAPGGPMQMYAALDGWAPTNRGGSSFIHTASGRIDGTELRSWLDRNWPLIAGLDNPGQDIGHAYVLTGIYWHYTAYGTLWVDYVVLRDPSPDALRNGTNRVVMPIDEFQSRLNSIYRVWVSN